jgi:hypothetical protein
LHHTEGGHGHFRFLSGEFIDVIHWTDDTRDTMVWRFERQGHAIKYGAKLTVREGQAAVFVHEGQLADVFTPGLYMLETNNMPILTTLQHWDHGFRVALQVRDLLRLHHPLHRPQVGHQEPDHPARPRVRPDAHPRLRHLFGAGDRPGSVPHRDRRHRRRVHPDEISFQIRNIIVQEFSRVIARRASPCSTWRPTPRSGQARGRAHLAGTIAAYGLTMPELLHREHLAATRRRSGARQAHLDGDGRRSGNTQFQRRPRR